MTSTSGATETPRELRKFGLIFAALVSALFGLLLPWLTDSLWTRLWPWYLSGIVALLALVWPTSLKPLYRFWMRFGAIAGWINTRIILLLLFYLLIFPVGLMMRLFGADPMRSKTQPSSASYRVIHPVQDDKHMEKPY